MATVEKPFLAFSASTSARVFSGVRLEAEVTKPALWCLTLATMAAWLSMDWEPKMKLMPPSFASAMASVSLDTDCMTAEVRGMFREMAGSSWPLRNLTSGVFRLTLSGMQSSEV